MNCMESLKNGKCVLEKSLNFWSKKGYEPWIYLHYKLLLIKLLNVNFMLFLQSFVKRCGQRLSQMYLKLQALIQQNLNMLIPKKATFFPPKKVSEVNSLICFLNYYQHSHAARSWNYKEHTKPANNFCQ